MYHDHKSSILDREEFAALGTDAIAYIRKITAEELIEAFPDAPKLASNQDYWAMFAANGEPLMLSDDETEIQSSAFYNDLETILPN